MNGKLSRVHPRMPSSSCLPRSFGLEKVQLLVHEYAIEDIYGAGRSIDYALRAADEKIAFEIDGLAWHHPRCDIR